MSLSDASRAALRQHLQSLTAGRYAIRPARELAQAVETVRQRFGDGQASLVTRDRVEAALIEVQNSAAYGRRNLFILAHALAQPLRVLGDRTVLQEDIGGRLLSYWEQQARRGELRSSHWRGLFRSYMQSEQGEACERLRGLLASTLRKLERHRASPPVWLAAVSRHAGLLGTEPCMPYVDELIDGKTVLLDDLNAQVGLPDASWFWVELRAAVLAEIRELRDEQFRVRLAHFLTLQEVIPNSRDDLLAAILERYSRCLDRGRHPKLLEVALDTWESPQLRSNLLWNFVSDEARQMVCGWLAQEDLEDFYRLCKSERQVDDRRLKFWLRFKEQMGYTQILLGGQLRYSRDADIREFIQNKRGRVGELTSGSTTNNAILMQIGGWLFIEFSETGNACYAYPVGETAIEVGRKSYSLNQLKPPARSLMRLVHMDGHEKWEQKFLASLRQVGVQPDSAAMSMVERLARPSNTTQGGRVTSVAANVLSNARGRMTNQDEAAGELLARLRELNVRVVDNRAKGGAIWAYPNGNTFPYSELRALGMKLKSDNQGFYWP